MALRPLNNPVLGTYWKTESEQYEPTRKNNPKIVVVLSSERKYARVGMQECFVSFISAVEYATKQQRSVVYRLDHALFMDLFELISDEELSNVLGLEILAFYD